MTYEGILEHQRDKPVEKYFVAPPPPPPARYEIVAVVK